MRALAAVAVLALGTASPAAAPQPKLDMTGFFSGRSHGEGVLRLALHRPAKLITDSIGRKGRNGEFILVDTVREEGKPVRQRRWVMRPDGPNRFAGTLTDAVGPVNVTVAGTRATVRYKMKGGLNIDQQMELQRDGKTLASRITIRKLGLRVGRFEGTIRKLD